MKKLFCILLALLLLAGCAAQEVPETTQPQTQYDWMAGESPVPVLRTGMERAGLNKGEYEVTNDGFYSIYTDPYGGGTYILYADHDGDTLIKLCGRADCTHDNPDCNAYLGGPRSEIAYCGGYLYVFLEGVDTSENKLVRMEPDGSNRVEILDLQAFAEENGADFAECDMITGGYLQFGLYCWEEQEEEGHFQSKWVAGYYYALDGSMDAPKLQEAEVGQLYSCGEVTLSLGDAQNGGEYGGYYDWDPETDTATFLCDHPGQPGWFGKKEAYYHKDGAVYRLTYETGKEEVLFKTGLTGDYYAILLPDCILVVSDDYGDPSDKNLYFYNWAYELVDTVVIHYPFYGDMVEEAIVAETAERIILTDSFLGIPRYYIEKSELGTGNAQIHAFKLPDLTSELEYWEDREWLENG